MSLSFLFFYYYQTPGGRAEPEVHWPHGVPKFAMANSNVELLVFILFLQLVRFFDGRAHHAASVRLAYGNVAQGCSAARGHAAVPDLESQQTTRGTVAGGAAWSPAQSGCLVGVFWNTRGEGGAHVLWWRRQWPGCLWQAGFYVRGHHREVHAVAWVHFGASVHVGLLRPDQSVHVEPEGRDEGAAPVEGVALVVRAGGRARGGACGVRAACAQVGQREKGAGPVAPPLVPPAVWVALVTPLLLLFRLLAGQGVGVPLHPQAGRDPVMLAAGPVAGGTTGEGGRSRGGSGDCGGYVAGVVLVFEVGALDLTRKKRKNLRTENCVWLFYLSSELARTSCQENSSC